MRWVRCVLESADNEVHGALGALECLAIHEIRYISGWISYRVMSYVTLR